MAPKKSGQLRWLDNFAIIYTVRKSYEGYYKNILILTCLNFDYNFIHFRFKWTLYGFCYFLMGVFAILVNKGNLD